MEKLEKRNNIRISYQFEILNLLRRGKHTITELADSLNISFTGKYAIYYNIFDPKSL